MLKSNKINFIEEKLYFEQYNKITKTKAIWQIYLITSRSKIMQRKLYYIILYNIPNLEQNLLV